MARDRRGRRRLRDGWYVGPDWFVRQLSQIWVLTEWEAVVLPLVSLMFSSLLLYRFSFLLIAPVVRCEKLRLPWSFRENGTGARHSVFCCGIGVEWFLTEASVPPGGRIVTVASKCRHCRFSCAEFHHSSHSSSETSPLRVCLSSHSLTVDGKCCGIVELSDGNILAVHASGYVLQDTPVN